MRKSSIENKKDVKYEIIQQLVEDSRQSPHEIAKKCGFSRQKVWRIINELEKKKEIWGYTTVIDDNNCGENIYFAFGKDKVPLFGIVDHIIKIIKNNKQRRFDINLIGVYFLNGLYDWVVIYSAQNLRDAKKFSYYIQNEYAEHLDRVDLIENAFILVKFGKINPEINKLKEFCY